MSALCFASFSSQFSVFLKIVEAVDMFYRVAYVTPASLSNTYAHTLQKNANIDNHQMLTVMHQLADKKKNYFHVGKQHPTLLFKLIFSSPPLLSICAFMVLFFSLKKTRL